MAVQFGAWVTLTHNSTGTCFIIHRLPAALQARTEGLRLKHDAGHTSAGGLRGDFEEAVNAEGAPGAVHPIIHDHPVPGRQCLYLGRRQDAYVVGIAPDDNIGSAGRNLGRAVRRERCSRQIWQPPDTVMWDNRCILHRRDGFPNNQNRILRHTQIGGDVAR